MKPTAILLPLLFLLLAAGALAAPTVTVDETVRICEGARCSNASTVRQGLEHIPPGFTTNVRYIAVLNDQPREKLNGTLIIADRSTKGVLVLRVQGVNTSTYRNAVSGALRAYYAESQASKLKYPVPSWMPYPGQCDMGLRLNNSRGVSVCVRRR